MNARFIRLTIGTLALYLISATLGSAVPLSQLTFNELQVGEEALNFYNAGFGNLGTGPGPSLGISFTPDFVTVAGGVIFPDSSILQSESLTGPSGTMNVSGGYSGLFSFYYQASQSSSARLFSGLNGTGSVVNVLALNAASIWTPAGGNLGPFQSIVFTGTGLAVDNITFGGLVVPESYPATLLFIGLAFFVLVTILKRFKRDIQSGW